MLWNSYCKECIVLYCIVSYCIVLYCIILYCIVLYCIVLYCIVLYCIVLYCIVLYCIVLYCIVLYRCTLGKSDPRLSPRRGSQRGVENKSEQCIRSGGLGDRERLSLHPMFSSSLSLPKLLRRRERTLGGTSLI